MLNKADQSFTLLFSLASLFLIGCAPKSRQDLLKDIEGFTLPGQSEKEAGMSQVYISRPSYVGALTRFDIYAENPRRDSLMVGSTKGGEHLWFSINPGMHKLVSVAENTAEIEINFKADSIYHFVQWPQPGLIVARNELNSVDSVQGIYFVKNTKVGTRLKNRVIVHDSLRLGGTDLSPRGLELFVGMAFGGVISGLQKQSGLVTEKGDTAGINKVGFNLAGHYFFHDHLGLQFETGGLWGSAVAPGAKDLNYTNAWSTNLGLIGTVWNQSIGMGFIRYSFAGGINYTRLAFAEDFKEVVTNDNPSFYFYDDAASGWGWYLGPEVEVVQKTGLVALFGLRYMEESPIFPNGTKALSAGQILGQVSLGYRF